MTGCIGVKPCGGGPPADASFGASATAIGVEHRDISKVTTMGRRNLIVIF